MSWSLNELEALARKAARGRGMTWGMAEETGRATRALCGWGMDAPSALAKLLQLQDGLAHDAVAPARTAGPWRATGGALCPIAAGCCLNDFATMLRSGPIHMHSVAQPLLLLGFVQMAARRLGQPVRLTIGAVQFCVTGDDIAVEGDLPDLPDQSDVTAALADAPFGTALIRHSRADVSDGAAAILTAFAHRTYAPATEASRLAGAGAGLSDND